MKKPEAKPVRTTSEEEGRELSETDLTKVSGGGPHVRVFNGASGTLLVR